MSLNLTDTVIYLPTRGRVDKQITLPKLPPSVLRHVVIICHPGEEREHASRWGSQVKAIWPLEASHIGEVRQRAIDRSRSDYIIFVDDSLDLHVRAESDTGTQTKYPLKGILPKHFTPNNLTRHVEDIFGWVDVTLREGIHGIVGISRRSDNFHFTGDYTYNTRICSFWGINRQLFRQLRGAPKFSDMQLKEDFYITLHFLTNGIPTITSYHYAYGRIGGANSEGGCSIYRNLENSNRAARELQQAFPAFVKLRKKPTRSWGGEFGEEALDVNVKWNEAYEYGINRHRWEGKGFFS